MTFRVKLISVFKQGPAIPDAFFVIAESIRPYASRTGLTGSSVPPVLFISFSLNFFSTDLVQKNTIVQFKKLKVWK